MHTKNENIVVVGGGIAGIVTALILAQQNKQVTLIEASDNCGGLLRTDYNHNNVPFDMGAHMLKETGIVELDALLYGDLPQADWQTLDRLKVGGYFANSLYQKSQFPDLRNLPDELRKNATLELLSTALDGKEVPTDAETHATQMYGTTITQEILKPILEKRYGIKMDQLHPSAIGLLGYSRFIAFDQFQTDELKRSSFYDQKIGNTSWDHGINPLQNFYPTEKGIQLWVDHLIEKLTSFDVKILTNVVVTSSIHIEGCVQQLELSNHQKIKTDKIYWTVSPIALLQSSKIKIPKNISPPQFRSTALAHLVFDKNFNTDLYYYYSHDADSLSYRTTLYSNLRNQKNSSAPFNCTVEVIADAETVEKENLVDTLLAEMIEHGIITDKHNVTYQKLTTSTNGFPLPTTSFHSNSNALANFCSKQFKNVTFLGRAGGQHHFMNDIMKHIWNNLTQN